jgi:hypothetical protein
MGQFVNDALCALVQFARQQRYLPDGYQSDRRECHLPIKERDDDERLASPMPYDDRSASPTAERMFLAAACTADHEPDADAES